MNRIVAYIKVLATWLIEPRIAWIGVAVTTPLLLFAFRHSATDRDVRIAGMFLQVLGVGTVAHGVRKTRQLFGEPTLFSRLRSWLSNRPRWRRDIVMMAGTGRMTSGLGHAHLDVWSEIQAGASEEAKVAALLANQQRLREGLAALRAKLEKTSRGHSQALVSEQEVRAAADAKLDAQLREAQTGGLHITVLGVVWLLLGIVLSSLPSEIVSWRH